MAPIPRRLRPPVPARSLAPILALALCSAAFVPPRALAQAPDPVQIQVATCLGDDCEPGWLPVRVRVANQGESELRARIVVTWLHYGTEAVSEASAVESFPRQSKRDLHFLLFVPPLTAHEGKVRVALEPESPRGPARVTELPLAVRPAQRWLSVSRAAGLMSDLPPREDPAASGIGRPQWDSGDARVDSLPESWVGYDRVHALMLGDFNVAELTEGQRTALVEWVLAGGNLLVSPGPDPLWLENDVLSRLVRIPVKQVGNRRELAQLESSFGPLNAREPFPFYRFEGGDAVIGRDDEVALTRFDAGLGSVWVLSFDLGRAPFAGWDARSEFWRAVIDRVPMPVYREAAPVDEFQGAYGRTAQELLDPRLEPLGRGLSRLPSMVLLLFVILLYLVVVGPVNYVVLRKLHLHIYTVVTVPLIALVFVVMIVGLGYLTRGVTTRAQSGSLTRLASGRSAGVTTAYGCVFAASPRGYRIDFGEGMVPMPMYATREVAAAMLLKLEEQGAPQIADYNLKLWETGFFQAQGFRDLGGPITAVLARNAVTVTNGSTAALKRAVLLSASGQVMSAPFSADPGETKTVPLQPPGPASADSLAGEFELEAEGFPGGFLGMSLDRLRGRSGVRVLGVLDKNPAPLRVDGKAPSLDHDVPLISVEVESGA